MMEEREFKKRADGALALLSRELAGAADDYGFRSEFKAGVITVQCGAAKFTIAVTPHTQQVLVTLPARSYKLDWDVVENAFVHNESGETLKDLIEQALSKQTKQDVSL